MLIKRAIRLEYFTLGYNLFEGGITFVLGLLAGSIALTGFSFDAGMEFIAAMVLLWRLKSYSPEHNCLDEHEEKANERALKIVGVTFILLASNLLITPGSV